jgi:hypothetical protein
VGFEIATRFVGAHYQVAKERQHQFVLRAKQTVLAFREIGVNIFDGALQILSAMPHCRMTGRRVGQAWAI